MTPQGHRFEIGTIVRHVGHISRPQEGKTYQTMTSILTQYTYLIVERLTQECHGGKQYSYRVRGVDSLTGGADEKLRDFQEFELEAL